MLRTQRCPNALVRATVRIRADGKKIERISAKAIARGKAEVHLRSNRGMCNEVNHLCLLACLLAWPGPLETLLLINFSDKLLARRDQRRPRVLLRYTSFPSPVSFSPIRFSLSPSSPESSNRGAQLRRPSARYLGVCVNYPVYKAALRKAWRYESEDFDLRPLATRVFRVHSRVTPVIMRRSHAYLMF